VTLSRHKELFGAPREKETPADVRARARECVGASEGKCGEKAAPIVFLRSEETFPLLSVAAKAVLPRRGGDARKCHLGSDKDTFAASLAR